MVVWCVALNRRPWHQAALTTIKKAGKARHARVDNATPRVLQFAHIHTEVGEGAHSSRHVTSRHACAEYKVTHECNKKAALQ